MNRRDFMITTAGVAAFAGLGRELFAQGRGQLGGLLPPTDWSADPGKPANAPAAKLARISIMTLNFNPILKLPVNPPNPNAAPNPNAPANAAPPPAKTLEPEKVSEYLADVYGVHNVEYPALAHHLNRAFVPEGTACCD